MTYTKQFLIDAFISRYISVFANSASNKAVAFGKMCDAFYDKVGKDKFRVYASLDADALKTYKNLNLN